MSFSDLLKEGNKIAIKPYLPETQEFSPCEWWYDNDYKELYGNFPGVDMFCARRNDVTMDGFNEHIALMIKHGFQIVIMPLSADEMRKYGYTDERECFC